MDSKATKRMGSLGAILAGLSSRGGQEKNSEEKVETHDGEKEKKIVTEESPSPSSKNEQVAGLAGHLKNKQNKTFSVAGSGKQQPKQRGQGSFRKNREENARFDEESSVPCEGKRALNKSNQNTTSESVDDNQPDSAGKVGGTGKDLGSEEQSENHAAVAGNEVLKEDQDFQREGTCSSSDSSNQMIAKGNSEDRQKKQTGNKNLEDCSGTERAAQSKVSHSVGAVLAGLGNRKPQMSEDSKNPQPSGFRCVEGSRAFPGSADGNKKEPADTAVAESKNALFAANNANSDKGKGRENKQRISNTKNADHDDDIPAKPVPKKAASGLGAILASLGNRQRQMSEDLKPFTSPGGRRGPETNNSKGSKISEEEKTDEGRATTSGESRVTMRKGTRHNNEEDEYKNLEAKKKHSLGSVLAGLANRRQEVNTNVKCPEPDNWEEDVYDQQQEADISEGHKQGFSSRRQNFSMPYERKTNVNKKESRKDYGEEVDVEAKRNRSLGSILAGLANRRHEMLSGKRQTFSSGWGNNREHNQHKKSWKEYEDDEENDYEDGQDRVHEAPVVKEEGNVIFVRGHKPKRKPNETDIENEKKAQANNMTFEEEAEMRKTHSIGSMLANLANRTFPDPPASKDNGRRDSSRGSSYDRDSMGNGRGGKDRSRGSSYDGDSPGFGRGSRKRTYSEEDDYEYDQRRGRRDSKDKQRREEWEDNKSNKKKKKEEFDPVKAAEEMKAESERLEKLLGKGVITVGFTEQRVMAYICEICQVQLTNKMNLEAHVDGMQHLRKKNLWDKRKRIAESEPSQYKGGKTGWVKVEKEDQKSTSAAPTTKVSSEKPKQVSGFPGQSARYGGGNGSYGYGGFDNYENYDGSYGQDGYNYSGQYFMQPPPFGVDGFMNMSGHMMGGYGQVPMNMNAAGSGKSNKNWGENSLITSQINTSVPPPPPPPVKEEPPKAKNAQGGATGSLLQRLDACAVKNAKDEELAFSVVSALLKSLKEFNHKQGDTKFIEALTEMDVKFRSLRRSSLAVAISSDSQSHEGHASAKYKTVAQESTSAASYSNINSSGSSGSAQYNLSSTSIPANSSGTWYSQGRSNTVTGSQGQDFAQRTSALEAVATNYASSETHENSMKSTQDGTSHTVSGYASQGTSNTKSAVSTGYASVTKGIVPSVPNYPPPTFNVPSYSAYGSDGSSSYPPQMNYYNTGYTSYSASSNNQVNTADDGSQGKTGAKETGYQTQGNTSNYTSYQGYSGKGGNNSVMEIIRSSNEPPPPPPPEKGAPGYAAQGYQTSMPPVCYRMTAPPPPFNPQS